MKAINGSANLLIDPIGILSNVAAFAKLHKIITTKLFKPGVGGDFLCTFFNRIECVWFVPRGGHQINHQIRALMV
jgi:hypothetical protein